jgi:hypothetical protein
MSNHFLAKEKQMKDQFRLVSMFILMAGILLVGCGGQTAAATAVISSPEITQVEPAADVSLTSNQIDCRTVQGETDEIADAKLYIEYNSTDEDLGIHGYLADDGWSELCVYNPGGELILGIKPQAQLKDVTMASVFFEGREPTLDEFGFEELTNFPEGQYEVRALSYDGVAKVGKATFSHAVPAPPVITYPPLVEKENAADALIPTTEMVVTWENVIETMDGRSLTISGYEVIITKVEHEDPHGFSRPIYDVHVSPEHDSLSVPSEFLEADTVYELEVLALEESGNQTITVGFFKTE